MLYNEFKAAITNNLLQQKQFVEMCNSATMFFFCLFTIQINTEVLIEYVANCCFLLQLLAIIK